MARDQESRLRPKKSGVRVFGFSSSAKISAMAERLISIAVTMQTTRPFEAILSPISPRRRLERQQREWPERRLAFAFGHALAGDPAPFAILASRPPSRVERRHFPHRASKCPEGRADWRRQTRDDRGAGRGRAKAAHRARRRRSRASVAPYSVTVHRPVKIWGKSVLEMQNRVFGRT